MGKHRYHRLHRNSMNSYNQLAASGDLSNQERRSVAETVRRGSGTSRELDERIGHGGRAWHPTYHRLEKRGVFYVVEERKCKISGHTAMVYDYTSVTRASPLPPTRKTPWAAILSFLEGTTEPVDEAERAGREWLLAKYRRTG